MYNSLKGTYSGVSVDAGTTQALIEVHGVEWQLEVSKNTLSRLPQQGEWCKLYTYLHHSEDQFYLCGFATHEERRVFFQLLKVQGIGPKAALKILSGTTPERLVAMLEASDVEGLEKIPGLGKKTSQKLLLTLQGKLVLDTPAPGATTVLSQAVLPDADIVQALFEMGFDRKEASTAVAQIASELAGNPAMTKAIREQELLRRAIVALS